MSHPTTHPDQIIVRDLVDQFVDRIDAALIRLLIHFDDELVVAALEAVFFEIDDEELKTFLDFLKEGLRWRLDGANRPDKGGTG